MGGLMTLEEPRQGYFLGKIVRKAKKAVKKVVKSPLGKAAILGAGLYGLGGAKFLGGQGMFAGGQGLSRFANLKNLFLPAAQSATGKRGLLAGLAFDDKGVFSPGRAALSGLGAAAIAAPFFMGGDEEEEDPGVPFGDPIASVEAVRDRARQYYMDPTNSALYFMPPKSAVRFGGAFAGGGLADIPRGGYDNGGDVMMASNIENDKILESLFEKYLDMGMSPLDAEKAAREEFEKMTTKPDIDRAAAAEGGLMDLGGMEKDYREGGFVPIGAEERADDVPARLSKNEFVFTADAVRNAGGGDIDKGAEVMQNMMDNLEAGGNISEESQGKENPAQEMFDQAQMLESRIV
jgi:hypothetical protein